MLSSYFLPRRTIAAIRSTVTGLSELKTLEESFKLNNPECIRKGKGPLRIVALKDGENKLEIGSIIRHVDKRASFNGLLLCGLRYFKAIFKDT